MYDNYRFGLLEGSKEKLLELSVKSSSSPNNGQHITKIIEPIIVIIEVKNSKEKLDLINQLQMFHVIQDPMAIYMETIFSKYSNVATFGIKSDCNSKYNFPMEFLI